MNTELEEYFDSLIHNINVENPHDISEAINLVYEMFESIYGENIPIQLARDTQFYLLKNIFNIDIKKRIIPYSIKIEQSSLNKPVLEFPDTFSKLQICPGCNKNNIKDREDEFQILCFNCKKQYNYQPFIETENIELQNRFNKLYELNKQMPIQRTEPWYTMREGMLTASDGAQSLDENPYSSMKDLIIKKCGLGPPFTTNSACLWGVKYEDVACKIYEYRNKCEIVEFGLLPHPTISFLGASPDGISKNGVMLEIKCPMSREITGIPPHYYWVQVQLQLECCQLDYCDFEECKLSEYTFEEDFYIDTDNNGFAEDGMEKGIVVEVYNNIIEKLEFYYSNIGCSDDEFKTWLKNTLDKIEQNNDIEYKQTNYWKLIKYSCVRITRNPEWFRKRFPDFEKFWEKVLYHRKNGAECLLPKKRVLKEKEPILLINIDTDDDSD